MARTVQEHVTPIMLAAQARRMTREQMLRAALKDGTAVQRDGRWFVVESDNKPSPRAPTGIGAA